MPDWFRFGKVFMKISCSMMVQVLFWPLQTPQLSNVAGLLMLLSQANFWQVPSTQMPVSGWESVDDDSNDVKLRLFRLLELGVEGLEVSSSALVPLTFIAQGVPSIALSAKA